MGAYLKAEPGYQVAPFFSHYCLETGSSVVPIAQLNMLTGQ